MKKNQPLSILIIALLSLAYTSPSIANVTKFQDENEYNEINDIKRKHINYTNSSANQSIPSTQTQTDSAIQKPPEPEPEPVCDAFMIHFWPLFPECKPDE